jgi:hypothetical protein
MNLDGPLKTSMRVVLLVATLSGVCQAQRPTAPRCYRLDVGAWEPALADTGGNYRIPPRIRLDTAAIDARWRRLEPAIVYTYGRDFTPGWEVRADTLRLVWSNGYASTSIRLPARGDTLAGYATADSDFKPNPPVPLPRAKIVAHPEPCPQ